MRRRDVLAAIVEVGVLVLVDVRGRRGHVAFHLLREHRVLVVLAVHVLLTVVVETLVGSDGWREHVHGHGGVAVRLLRGRWAEVGVLRCLHVHVLHLGSLVLRSHDGLLVQEAVQDRGDRGEVPGGVLPRESLRGLLQVGGEVEHNLRVVAGGPVAARGLLAVENASSESKCRASHD